MIGMGESSEHALGLIDKIVRAAACPVIVPLHFPDPGFVREASKRGVFAHISDDGVNAFQMLRERSRTDNRKLIDLAAAIVDGHRLLPKQPYAPAEPGRRRSPPAGVVLNTDRTSRVLPAATAQVPAASG